MPIPISHPAAWLVSVLTTAIAVGLSGIAGTAAKVVHAGMPAHPILTHRPQPAQDRRVSSSRESPPGTLVPVSASVDAAHTPGNQPVDSLELPKLLSVTSATAQASPSDTTQTLSPPPLFLPSPQLAPDPLPPMITQEELQYVDVHEDPTLVWLAWESFTQTLTAPLYPLAGVVERLTCSEHDEISTELSPYSIGIQPLPERPPLVFEWNEKFLAPGFLNEGLQMPTGVVWRPALWVFGEYRTDYAYRENPTGTHVISEVAQRLDLFGQLNLSGTERLLIGLRPFDQETNGISAGGRQQAIRKFSSYDFGTGDGISGTNGDIQTLFFEGDFGEIFPNLDPYDTEYIDYGFSVGRQPLLIQDGLMINEDMIDLASVTRNTLFGYGSLNTRATAVYAWNRINRQDRLLGNVFDPGADMIGLFTESDFPISTVNADLAYVNSSLGGLFVWGLSAIQRLHGYRNTYNTSFHLLGSQPTGGIETPVAGQGELLFSQVSWTPHRTEDLVYFNAFWAIDQYTSAARGPLTGGPLGQVGILFAGPQLGRYAAPLSNQASNAFGGSIGYQMFFDHTRQQVIFEVGARDGTLEQNTAAVAVGAQYQRALGQHWILVLDSFVARQESQSVSEGVRVELRAKF